MDGDPYEGIPGFTRKQAKAALLTAFNSKKSPNMKAAIASLTDNRQGKHVCATQGEAHRLLEALKVRHAPIAKMLCSDAGMRLMNIDSRVMLTAVDRLIGQGIPCIPVHDSLVIPEHYEGDAREALHSNLPIECLGLGLYLRTYPSINMEELCDRFNCSEAHIKRLLEGLEGMRSLRVLR